VSIDHTILYNLKFLGGPADAVMIKSGATNVWLSHLTLENYFDGLVDVTRASTDVTVSWSEFKNHSKTMISGSGGAPEDVIVRMTIHNNYFHDTAQRHPSVSYGKAHAFNNYLVDIDLYGMRGRNGGQLYSEKNYFERVNNPIIADRRSTTPNEPLGRTKSVNNTFDNISGNTSENDPDLVFTPTDYYQYSANPADQILVNAIKDGAGWKNMELPK
jgi:pectate lyase